MYWRRKNGDISGGVPSRRGFNNCPGVVPTSAFIKQGLNRGTLTLIDIYFHLGFEIDDAIWFLCKKSWESTIGIKLTLLLPTRHSEATRNYKIKLYKDYWSMKLTLLWHPHSTIIIASLLLHQHNIRYIITRHHQCLNNLSLGIHEFLGLVISFFTIRLPRLAETITKVSHHRLHHHRQLYYHILDSHRGLPMSCRHPEVSAEHAGRTPTFHCLPDDIQPSG